MAHGALDSAESWTQFFIDAGISEEQAPTYSTTFHNNRMTAATLPDLNLDLLKQLGVRVIGDGLAILKAAKSDARSQVPTFKPSSVSVKLPSITAEMTHPQFRKFKIDWEVYKKMTSLPTTHISNYLYSACDDEVQNSLINSGQDPFTLPETELLKAIEDVVTKKSNPAIHRMHFGGIIQNENETVQDFLVRLRSAAIDCEYACPSCQFDLGPSNIKDQLIRGLHKMKFYKLIYLPKPVL